MRIGRSGFIYIIHIFTLNELNKARLYEFYKFKYDYKKLILIYENKKKMIKKRFNFLIKNKKCYAYNKINHFMQNCRSKNLMNKNKTFANIFQQLNIIKKEYFIKILN